MIRQNEFLQKLYLFDGKILIIYNSGYRATREISFLANPITLKSIHPNYLVSILTNLLSKTSNPRIPFFPNYLILFETKTIILKSLHSNYLTFFPTQPVRLKSLHPNYLVPTPPSPITLKPPVQTTWSSS